MKTIHKILGLLPTLVAALMLIACSSEDNTTETPQTGTPQTDEVKTINYSVTVSQSGDAQTRATVDADMKTLRFASGDKLFITSDSRADLRGYLTLNDGDEGKASGATFTGTLEYTGADPSDDLGVKATLVGTANLGFTISSDGKAIEGDIVYPSTSFCSTVNDAVEKYSNLTGTSTYGARSFSLTQGTAFLNFSLTMKDGTATATDITATVKNGETTLSTATVTTATVSSDVMANFVLPVAATTTLDGATVTVGSHPAISFGGTSAKSLTGKVYNVARWAPAPTLGDLFYSDGCYSSTGIDGKTAIGVIAYLGTDAFTENGVTLRDNSTTLQSHGLVLCLKDIVNVKWRKSQSDGGPPTVDDFSPDAYVNDTGDLKRTTNVSGYANTKLLAEKQDAESNYPAAYQAWNFSVLTAPATTTGWFMPTIQQWVKILTGLGGMSESDIVWMLPWHDPSLTTLHNLEAAMEKAGAKGTAYDGMSDSDRIYWSSSESTAGGSADITVEPIEQDNDGQQGLLITYDSKRDYENCYVRPVLAF